MFSYSLTEDDLKKVFSRYGRLHSVELQAQSRQSAVVTFVHLQDAELAVRDLNHKVLTGVHGRLHVSWSSAPPPASSTPQSGPGISSFDSPIHLEVFPASAVTLPGAFNNSAHTVYSTAGPVGYASSPDFPTLAPGGGGGGEVRKYTARFEIGVENEKDFQVARRLIGVKGQNMKHINKTTEAKLRLRGKGSGYLEGVSKQESPEPLHLCVSCVSHEGYKRAVTMVQELLESIYEDYRKFCRNKNLPVPVNLRVSMRELPLVAFGGGGGDSPAVVSHDF